MPESREDFAKRFIERGQQSGASKEEISSKLDLALKDYDNQFGQQPGLLKTIGKSLVDPVLEYGAMVGEAGYQAGKFATTPEMRRASMPGIFGEASDEDLMNLVKTKPTAFMKEEALTGSRGDIVLEGTKRTAGAMAYAVPGGKSVAGAVKVGAAAGALAGFGASEKGEEIGSTIAGGILGGVISGVVYKGTSSIPKIYDKAKTRVSHIIKKPSKVSKEVADDISTKLIRNAESVYDQKIPGKAESIYSSGFRISKKNYAMERLRPQETASTMIEDGIWGSPETIITKSNQVTGKNGILSGMIKDSLKKHGDDVILPDDMITKSAVEGKYTTLTVDDVAGLNTRFSKAAPGGTVTGKDPTGLFDFQRTLEKEAFTTLTGKTPGEKTTEFALLKLDMARAIERELDAVVEKSGVAAELSNDPVVIDWLADNISENLARKVKNSGGDLRILRSLQKDYYRMGQIAQLSQQESSSLGGSLFGWINKIPVVGEVIEGALSPFESMAATGIAVGSKNIPTPSVPQVPMPSSSQISRVAGQAGVQSLQSTRPGIDLGAYSQEGTPLYK